jgi:hypothetical protein
VNLDLCAPLSFLGQFAGTGIGSSVARQLGYEPVGPYKLHPGPTFFLFSPTHPLRVLCARLVTHPHFIQATLLLIALSSLLLALDNPLLDPQSLLYVFLDRIDYVLTILFTVEMAVKMVTHGLLLQPSAYLRDPWNVLDAFVVLVSYVGYVAPNMGKPSAKP